MSVSPSNHVLEFDDLDIATSRLIAKLMLEDIAEIDARHKGKARADAHLSDQELALREQRQYWENSLRLIDDHVMAKSMNDAMNTDHRFIRAVTVAEQAAQDDRRAALSLSNGGHLPPQSNAQRSVESKTFSIPDPSNESPSPNVVSAAARKGGLPQKIVIRGGDAITSPVSTSKGKGRAEPSLSRSSVLAPPAKIECISCLEPIKVTIFLKSPCGHSYCRPCLTELVQAATRDESLYPPRCCSQPFPYDDIVPLLSTKLLQTFNIKRTELDVPANDRVYCTTPTCSNFLGSSKRGQSITCSKCGVSSCTQCKQKAHLGDCAENQSLIELLKLAKAEQWQTCPGCNAIVELHMGCYHMTCRCRFQFCYLCARTWKNCTCPQWEERRLFETAEQRVIQNNPNLRAPIAQPMLQERVREMADTLRAHHDCVRHSWTRRNGAAHCEECRNRLRDYILVCRQCQMRACVRCARNRLP